MSEDVPLEPVAPESATEPTEPVPTATPAGPPPWPSPAATQEAPRPPSRSTVSFPKWLLLVVGAVVIAALSFAAGWAVAPGDGSNGHGAQDQNRERAPGRSDNGGGSGNQPRIPSLPPQLLRAAFLGVATNSSTDPGGVRIVRLVPGSPAAGASLKVGDVITKVDDNAVTSPEQLGARIRAHRAGDRVTITYVRGGTTDTARVTLARRSAPDLPIPSTTQPRL